MRFYFGVLHLTAVVFAPFSHISHSPPKHFYCLQPNGKKKKCLNIYILFHNYPLEESRPSTRVQKDLNHK